jgi:hypothetical protein
MSPPALLQLVEQIRALPGDATNRGLPRAGAAAAVAEPLTAGELRRRVGAWMAAVAGHVAAVLPGQLAKAAQAWDQADDFVLITDQTRSEAARLRAAADALAGGSDTAARATGVEARLAIDAVAGLVALVERRFAGVVRLRLRSEQTELLVDGRPFLDVAAALAEAARAWR